jgi:hypothetical protein
MDITTLREQNKTKQNNNIEQHLKGILNAPKRKVISIMSRNCQFFFAMIPFFVSRSRANLKPSFLRFGSWWLEGEEGGTDDNLKFVRTLVLFTNTHFCVNISHTTLTTDF